MTSTTTNIPLEEPRLPFWKKLIYGTGDWSREALTPCARYFMQSF